MEIRAAAPQDARDLAYLIDVAGDGLPRFVWDGMRGEDQTPLEFGALRAARGEGAFSYRNARVAESEGAVAGMVLSYRLPDPYEVGDLGENPEPLRPLLDLEALAPGSLYINAIATYERFRGMGIATALLSLCAESAARVCASTISLIVASGNEAAKRLYEGSGFEAVASRPIVAYPGCTHDGEWLLMVRPFVS